MTRVVRAPSAGVLVTAVTALALPLALLPGASTAGTERPRARTSATAVPATAFEMPFPCGESWTGTTRDGHSPSRNSVDWNRPDDEDDPVVASAPGVVVRVESLTTSYGRWVMLEHPTGERTVHAHLATIDVTLGQSVDQGARIGTVGSTGRSSGTHLHYEQRDGSGVMAPWFHGAAFVFGSTLVSQNCPDVPLAGDFLGGPESELVVYRRGTRGTFLVQRPGTTPRQLRFGRTSDQPVLGDWDGNGRANPGVRGAGAPVFRLRAPGGVVKIRFGEVTDLPVAGDWDGDGRWEVGVRRAGERSFLLRSADGQTTTVALGDADDLPVTGDWDGDGRTDVGVFDQATAVFTLRVVDDGGLAWTAEVPFGEPGDLPVAGDWNGDDVTEVGVWSPATATFSERRAASPTAARSSVRTRVFGRPR